MARRKPAGKTRKATTRKPTKKAASKTMKRSAPRPKLGPARSIAGSVDTLATVIARLNALKSAAGAETVQGELKSAVTSLEAAHVDLLVTCRKARKVLD